MRGQLNGKLPIATSSHSPRTLTTRPPTECLPTQSRAQLGCLAPACHLRPEQRRAHSLPHQSGLFLLELHEREIKAPDWNRLGPSSPPLLTPRKLSRDLERRSRRWIAASSCGLARTTGLRGYAIFLGAGPYVSGEAALVKDVPRGENLECY